VEYPLVRDAFFASPQFPKLLNADAIKDTIANGVTNASWAMWAKLVMNQSFYFETDLHAYEVEILTICSLSPLQ